MNLRVLAHALIATTVAMLDACDKDPPGFDKQWTFSTPDSAAATFVATLERSHPAEFRRLLGPGTEGLLSSGDGVADWNARHAFLRRYGSQHQWVAGGPDDLVLQVGPDAWPMPIPLVRENGHWRFDGAAGTRELLSRRIGANELRTIDVIRGFVAAQFEYAASTHDGVEAGVFARKLRSDPGKENGLYWQPHSGEPPSPAGPFLAAAATEGYVPGGEQRAPYHGYVFKLLLAQGPDAQGGLRDYIEQGRLTGGFALLARPVAYGESGIMTFMVNQDGLIWQRDLGGDTAQLADAIQIFDPDASWAPLLPEY